MVDNAARLCRLPRTHASAGRGTALLGMRPPGTGKSLGPVWLRDARRQGPAIYMHAQSTEIGC